MGYGNLAGSYFLTGRFAEAERTIQAASERKLEFDRLFVIGYNIAVLKGDQEQMDRSVALARGKRRVEHWIAHAQSLALARSGRLQAARRSSNRALELALQEGQRETAAIYQAVRATWEALCGNAGEGTRNAMAALERSNGREVEYAAALALGLSGGSSRSEALAGDLEQRFPEDTFVKFTYVPVLRGLAELRRGKPEHSVERLQVALRYELAANGLNFAQLSWRSALGLRARRGLDGRATVCRSGGRIPEGSRSSRYRRHRSHRRAGTPATRSGVRSVGR